MQPQASNETSSPWYEAFSPPERPVEPTSPAPPDPVRASAPTASADLPSEALFNCYNA